MLGVYAVKVDRKEKTQRQWWRFLKDFKEMRLGQTWEYDMRVRLSEDMDVCEEECAKGLEEGLGRAEDVGSLQEEEDSNRDGQAYPCGSCDSSIDQRDSREALYGTWKWRLAGLVWVPFLPAPLWNCYFEPVAHSLCALKNRGNNDTYL